MRYRFNRIAWGQVHKDRSRGVIAAGMENGELALWDPAKIIAHVEFVTCINPVGIADHCVVSLAHPSHLSFATRFILDPSVPLTSTRYKPIFYLLARSVGRSVPSASMIHVIMSTST